MGEMFFQGWEGLLRTLIVGVFAYVSLIFILRISGRRTLSKMNAFDFVVTVALGSTLATILLNTDVALAEGIVALSLLVGLQYLITWTSVRALWVRKVVTGEPVLLLYRGMFLPDNLRRARVARDEVQAALRSAGIDSVGDADAVVLETDGSFSVIQSIGSEPSALANLELPASRGDGTGGGKPEVSAGN